MTDDAIREFAERVAAAVEAGTFFDQAGIATLSKAGLRVRVVAAVTGALLSEDYVLEEKGEEP